MPSQDHMLGSRGHITCDASGEKGCPSGSDQLGLHECLLGYYYYRYCYYYFYDLRPTTYDLRPTTYDLRPTTYDLRPTTNNDNHNNNNHNNYSLRGGEVRRTSTGEACDGPAEQLFPEQGGEEDHLRTS